MHDPGSTQSGRGGAGISFRLGSSALDFAKDLAPGGPSRLASAGSARGGPRVQIAQDRSASADALRETPPPPDCSRMGEGGEEGVGPS